MADLDLNINNYTITDIEHFFKLKPNSNYTASSVELRENEIKEQLLKSGNVNRRIKQELVEFLNAAKTMLITMKCAPLNNPTTIPKNARLDTFNIPMSNETAYSRECNLIKRPTTQYIHTHNTEYLQGNLNQLNTRVISKYVTIDTRFRDNVYNTSSSDITFNLPFKLNKVVSTELNSIEIPISFYGISAKHGNNYLNITIQQYDIDNDDNITSDTTLIIPEGNYNGVELITEINNLLSTNINVVFTFITFTLNISNYGSGTGTVTIDCNNQNNSGNTELPITNLILDFTLDVNRLQDNVTEPYIKLGWSLGFTKTLYTGQTSYTTEGIIDPAPIRYIYLAIDDYNTNSNNHFITAFNQSIFNPNIIARIPINASFFTLIIANSLNMVTAPRQYFGPVDIQRLRIQLLDEFGRVLEMNRSDYSICLTFKMLYDL